MVREGLLLKGGSIVDATIIAAPSSTKNGEGERDPETYQTKRDQWHFGMKAHVGVDADSGLVHTATTSAADETDVEQVAGPQRAQKHEREKASARQRRHPFRVIKRQFGLVKVPFRGLAKNTAHIVTPFALSKLWIARKQLMVTMGVVRPKPE